MKKSLLTAMALSGLMVIGSACSRQGDARETTRDTTSYRTPTDTATLRDTSSTRRDTSMMRDSGMRHDSTRDTTRARRP
jgi:hypothetical protein